MKSLTFLLAAVTVAAATPAVAQPSDITQQLCNGRPNCKLRWAKTAGVDPEKRKLTVVDLGLAGDVDYDEPRIGEECHAHEIWLVVGNDKVHSKQLISKLCNDGYGARGIGEDLVEVTPNRVLLRKTGGSSWTWTSGWEIALSPQLRIVAESTSGFWAPSPDHQEDATWSWEEFSGQTSWSAPTCGKKPVVRSARFAAIPIPVVEGAWDWKTTALGKCSLHLTAADAPLKRGGGVVHGKRSTTSDASLRVLGRSDQEFVLEIRDDRFHATAKSWVKRDHVELWVGESQSYMNHCLEKGRAVQWGIMLDGEVIAAHAKPQQKPTVEVVRDRNIVRMLVKLPKAAPMLTFVYSDSDDGKSQERLIATSELKFGKNYTLGRTRPVAREDAICRVEDSKLTIRRTAAPSAQPLVKW